MDTKDELDLIAKKLRDSLAFAAPEIWRTHIDRALEDAFDMGARSVKEAPVDAAEPGGAHGLRANAAGVSGKFTPPGPRTN